jgi:predicted nucleic acid-binding protein
MKILFDSSIIIAAFIESHPKHSVALSYLVKAKKKEFELLVSSHTILEVYSVLTSAPFNPRITPQIAKQLIENNIKNLAKIISLSAKDYFKILDKVSHSNLSGGIVYDAIIMECALISNADEVLTFNIKDFLKLANIFPVKVRTL